MTPESDAVKALFVYEDAMHGKAPSMRNRVRAMQKALESVASKQPMREIVKNALEQKEDTNADD